MKKILALTFLALALPLSSCASYVVVKKVSSNDTTTPGLRYYLPKPFIVFAPQADGTVSATVIFLPDSDHEYAIQSISRLSSYAFQASTDASGLLTAVQYSADTTALATQTAASVGGGLAQAYNLETAQAAAVQAQVNTAQAAVITAQSDYNSALAALNSDNQANVATPGTVSANAIAQEQSLVAQEQAALEVAQAALKTAKSTPQVVAGAAATGTPITTTAATVGTSLGAPTWNPTSTIHLPGQYGPVLFAVNDDGTNVSLNAVKAKYGGALHGPNRAQPGFKTTLLALGPPKIPVPATPFSIASHLPAVFLFPRKVMISECKVYKTDAAETPTRVQPVYKNGKNVRTRTVTLDIWKLRPGGYWLEVHYAWHVDAKISAPASQSFVFAVVTKTK